VRTVVHRVAEFGAVAEQIVVRTVDVVGVVLALIVDLVTPIVRAADAVVAVRNGARLDDAVLNIVTDFDTVAVLSVVAVGVVLVVLAPIHCLIAPIVRAIDSVITIGHGARLGDAVQNAVADFDTVAPLAVVAVFVILVVLAPIHGLVAPIVRARHAVAAVAGRSAHALTVLACLVNVAVQQVIAGPPVGLVIGVAIAVPVAGVRVGAVRV
jgi:hypothetical protein